MIETRDDPDVPAALSGEDDDSADPRGRVWKAQEAFRRIRPGAAIAGVLEEPIHKPRAPKLLTPIDRAFADLRAREFDKVYPKEGSAEPRHRGAGRQNERERNRARKK